MATGKSKWRLRSALLSSGGSSKASCSMLFRIFIRGIRWLLEVQIFRGVLRVKRAGNHFARLLKNEINAILRGCSDAKITQPVHPHLFRQSDDYFDFVIFGLNFFRVFAT